jgi:Acetoacetate decarboxylase (ADC)
MTNVPFIRYGGNFMVPQPFAIREASAYGFAVRGDVAKMQALCDTTLNLAPHTRYRVLSSTVLITFMRMERLTSTQPAVAALGSFSETELNVAIFLAAEEKIGPIWVPQRLVWNMPYLWLDSNHAMIAGREIYGFPKNYGTISMPLRAGESAQFSASSEVLHRFGPHERGVAMPIATVRRTDANPLEFERPFDQAIGAFREFVEEVLDITDPFTFVAATLGDLTAEHMLKLTFLCQLPSIVDGSRACFQGIAEASAVPTARAAGLLRGDYEIEIPYHDSVPWARELGLVAGPADALLTPHAGFYLDMDFDLTAGREIWTAT